MKWAVGCLVLILVIVGVAVMYVMGLYNGLVSADETVTEKWAQVETVYQRRADLIPNLVTTVKGAAEFEQETLNQVVEARSRVGQITAEGVDSLTSDPAKFAQFQAAQDGLSSALQRLLVVVERYPELKAVAAFQDLMVQLEGAENRIAVERNRYNQAARDLNVKRRRIPARWFIDQFGWDFPERVYFSADEGTDEVPVVEF